MQQEQQEAGLGQAADCTQPHPLTKTLLHIYCLLSFTVYSRAKPVSELLLSFFAC